jgi:hypothetical protein
MFGEADLNAILCFAWGVRLRRTGLYSAAWEGSGGLTKPPFD